MISELLKYLIREAIVISVHATRLNVNIKLQLLNAGTLPLRRVATRKTSQVGSWILRFESPRGVTTRKRFSNNYRIVLSSKNKKVFHFFFLQIWNNSLPFFHTNRQKCLGLDTVHSPCPASNPLKNVTALCRFSQFMVNFYNK